MKKHILSYEEISQLCLELSLLVHAGATIGDGLVLLADETDEVWLKDGLNQIAKEIDDGKAASAAFRNSSLFPCDVVSMLEVGERTGRIEQALASLSKHYENKHIMDARIKAAIVYPSILLLIMLTVIVTLLTKVLPIFTEVYASHGGSINGFAGILMHIGTFLNSAFPLLILIFALAVSFIIAISFSERFRETVFFGSGKEFKGLTKSVACARFASAFAMGIASGLTTEDAVKTASLLIGNIKSAKTRCEKCFELLEAGSSLSDALSATGLMPKAECRLLSMGIAGGNCEIASEEIASKLENAAETETERKVNAIEPFIVTVTSVLIGLILLSVMLPLTNIMSAIG